MNKVLQNLPKREGEKVWVRNTVTTVLSDIAFQVGEHTVLNCKFTSSL